MNKEAHEKFRTFLKNGENHRITPERFEVMDAALEYDGHFGADELYIAMKNNNSRVSRATVYKTLELLEQCEILVKRNFGDNMNRYESNMGRKSHDHLVCINCGKIVEFSTPKLKGIVDLISEELGYNVSGYSFNIFGKCKNDKECRMNCNGK